MDYGSALEKGDGDRAAVPRQGQRGRRGPCYGVDTSGVNSF
jgi:hypothetical protein